MPVFAVSFLRHVGQHFMLAKDWTIQSLQNIWPQEVDMSWRPVLRIYNNRSISFSLSLLVISSPTHRPYPPITHTCLPSLPAHPCLSNYSSQVHFSLQISHFGNYWPHTCQDEWVKWTELINAWPVLLAGSGTEIRWMCTFCIYGGVLWVMHRQVRKNEYATLRILLTVK